jgi:hypothetical protein
MKVIVIDEKLENEIYRGVDPLSDDGLDIFGKFMEDNNYCYYSELGDKFDLNVGIAMAERNGCAAVLVENLS